MSLRGRGLGENLSRKPRQNLGLVGSRKGRTRVAASGALQQGFLGSSSALPRRFFGASSARAHTIVTPTVAECR
jgi:hypothetical protein